MFLIRLENGQEAQVDCEHYRMKDDIVRTSLSDPAVNVADTSCLIAFRVTQIGKPLKPIATALEDISCIGQIAEGITAMITASRPSSDELVVNEGLRIYPTLPRQADVSAVRALIEAAKAVEGPPRRLFFARIEGALTLVDTRMIYKAPRARKSNPSPTVPHAPSEAPTAE